MRRVVLGVLAALLSFVTACGSPTPAADQPPTATSTVGQITPAEIAEPAGVEIPKIGATSTLVPLGLNADQTVQVPPVDQPMQAGWYREGPKPGELGPAVILGHVDGGGKPGIFHRLKELAAGDEILVSSVDGVTSAFVVRSVEQTPKNRFPTDKVYGDTAQRELRLITCGGSFDHAARSYRDNIIVYAELAD